MSYDVMSDEELRRAVAERLGWESVGVWTPAEGEEDEHDVFGVPPVGRTVIVHGRTKTAAEPVPLFSTSIAAAWTLVDLAEKQEIGVSIVRQTSPGGPIEIGDWGWFVEFRRGGNCYAAATTAPRAICIAYLKLCDTHPTAKETK